MATMCYPNIEVLIEANVTASGQTVPLPGTGEDLSMFSGINTNPLTTGIGNTLKTAVAGNTVTLKVVSTGGTVNNREFVLIGQGFPTGFPPFPPIFPNIHMSWAG